MGTAPYAYQDGGAFVVNINSGGVTSSNTAGLAPLDPTNPADFESFCLETLMGVETETPYNYTVGLSLQQIYSNNANGNGVPGTDGHNGTSKLADTGLTEGVAWLYEQYATGALNGTNEVPSFSYTSVSSAGALQAAIWDLENQTPTTSPTTSPTYSTALSTDLVNLAENAIDPGQGGTPAGLAAAQTLVTLSNHTDTWDVYVLELSSNGQPAQDQLIYSTSIQVPDGGRTIALLGAALLALAFFRRRAALQV
jgi:hypothetical protein